jgi:hypothetical protein
LCFPLRIIKKQMKFIISNFKLNKIQLFGTIVLILLWVIFSYKILFPFRWEIERMLTITENINLYRLIGFAVYSAFFLGNIGLWIYIWRNSLSFNYWLKIVLFIIGFIFIYKGFYMIGEILIK